MSEDRHAALMDKVYRYQRYIYDITRKYFLLGRDLLIEEIVIPEDAKVLEIGFGTGRNLAILAKRYPSATLYGIDASQAMLETAEKKLAAEVSQGRVVLAHCLAEEVDPQKTFNLDGAGFDAVIFSYSLSMIPGWEDALNRAYEITKPGGVVGVVDFYDQSDFPTFFRRGLKKFLASFHVQYNPAFVEYLKKLGSEVRGLYGNYAFLAFARKA